MMLLPSARKDRRIAHGGGDGHVIPLELPDAVQHYMGKINKLTGRVIVLAGFAARTAMRTAASCYIAQKFWSKRL